MELDRASAIVADCSRHVFWAQGIADESPPGLGAYTLAELLEANHVVRDAPDHHQVFCDDRLVAALYTLYHYDAADADAIDPIARCPGKALCCVAVQG